MELRAQSLQKKLIIRSLALAAFLSLLVGGLIFVQQVSELEHEIFDRTELSVEWLKSRVRDQAVMTQTPWQTTVQSVLDDLKQTAPRSRLGQFIWVSVRDSENLELAGVAEESFPNIDELITAATQQLLQKPATIEPFENQDLKYSFLINQTVNDANGKTLAKIQGIYLVSKAMQDNLWLHISLVVGFSVLVVILTTLLNYPLFRGLLSDLSRLSIHLLDANLETVQGLGSAIAKRDSDTDAHNFRVTIYAVQLAESMALEPGKIRSLIKGAFLHDVGKIGVRDHILLKQGRLDADEFTIMKTHVLHGLDIVNKCAWLQDAAEVVGFHHEKFDGSGYYQGLKGEDIPVSARIFAIVDVFDALTSERPYKKAMTFDESIAILQQGVNNHFDPQLTEKFITIAPKLYQQFSHDDEAARFELKQIVQRYFKGDIGELLQEHLA
jgi:HD-GYP domain-containing protein (c-di-GMP phosphodiesterase class II)